MAPYGNARTKSVAIYARPIGKNTNDGVEKKLLHKQTDQVEKNRHARTHTHTHKQRPKPDPKINRPVSP